MFNQFSIPSYLDILLDNILVWDFQDKFASKITQRFLNTETRSIAMPLISRARINPFMFGFRHIQRELV